MRHRLVPALLAAAVGAGAASAGPWPYAAGEGFASAAWRGTPATGTEYSALYLEYGLGRRWSVGVDAGRAIGGATKTIAFVGRARAKEAAGPRIGWQLGVGRIDGQAVVRPGLSIGHAFGHALGNGAHTGWVSADGLAEIGVAFDAWGRPVVETDVKLDVTVGLSHGDDRKTVLQLQAGQEEGDPPFRRLELRRVQPLYGGTSLTLGAYRDLSDGGAGGLVVGLWQRF